MHAATSQDHKFSGLGLAKCVDELVAISGRGPNVFVQTRFKQSVPSKGLSSWRYGMKVIKHWERNRIGHFHLEIKTQLKKKKKKNAVSFPSLQSNELQLPTSISFGHLFDSDSASDNFIMTG